MESGKERGALPLDEVFQLLRDHGYPFDHRASEERSLAGVRIAVGKDKKLVRHANDTVGLIEWYPNRKKVKGARDDDAANDNEAADEAADEDADEPAAEPDTKEVKGRKG